MANINVKVNSDFDLLLKKYSKEFTAANAKAITATINEVIKYTLPSSPTSKGTAKQQKDANFDFNKLSASKAVGAINENIKQLRKRIKQDILGGTTKAAIPSAIPANEKGIIARGTKQGVIKAGFVVLRQSKSKKKKNVKIIQPALFTSDVNALIKHIVAATALYKKSNVARRLKRKGTKIMWIDSKDTAIKAAEIMSRDAGALLSGWRGLQNKVLAIKGIASGDKTDILSKVLVNTNQKKNKGQGTIKQTDDVINIRATNTNVEKPVYSYQQSVVDSTLKINLKKHLENEIKFFIKKVEKEMKKESKLKK